MHIYQYCFVSSAKFIGTDCAAAKPFPVRDKGKFLKGNGSV